MHTRTEGLRSPSPMPASGPWLAVSALLFLLVAEVLAPVPARAERWLCPDCPKEVVDRPRGAPLVCPGCGTSYTVPELAPPVAYINVSTRDTEIAFIPRADSCRVFRPDGLEALVDRIGAPGAKDTLWVPWILVEWYIPRMRLLKLTDGRELGTDYPKEMTYCPSPPKFAYEVSDSLTMPGRPAMAIKEQGEYSLAEFFIIAFTPEARDSARVRFIKEVEAGKHPRLPRTQPHVLNVPTVVTPASLARPDLKAEAVIEVRVHERRGIIGAHVLKSSGQAVLDREALRLAQMVSFSTAGELGVMVPSWVEVHVYYEGAGGRVEVTPAKNGFWRR
jgi:TonB family protein